MNIFDKLGKTYIKDFLVGRRIEALFRVLSVEKRQKKDGGSYLTMELLDKTGRINAKAWDNAETYIKIIKPGQIYRVTGMVNEYQNKKELKVDAVKVLAPTDTDYVAADFEEQAGFDTGDLFGRLIGLLKGELTNPQALELVDLFAQEHGPAFKKHYGAMKIHHAYMGGLLEHTFSMLQLAVFLAGHYNLDKDVLLLGVLFHDIGKLKEFSIDPSLEMTSEGGLLGHIIIGHSIFQEMVSRIQGFPEDISFKVRHLIISHHGEKEYGSPEEPKTLEAFALHVIDLLDSRAAIMNETLKKNEGKGLFTDFINSLGLRLYVDPNAGKKN